jgi:hypothetical protein
MWLQLDSIKKFFAMFTFSILLMMIAARDQIGEQYSNNVGTYTKKAFKFQ